MARILVVDDEHDVYYSFRRLFGREGMEILWASSGEEALELLADSKVDLIIMDIRMGGMSGLETLQLMQRRHPKIPVIIMTAYGTTQTAIESMKYGAYDYLLKPLDIKKLKEVVEEALALSRTMSQVVHFPLTGKPPEEGDGIVGRSEAMQQIYKKIGQVAPSDVTVLITGERGTGKELVARAIYHHSHRSNKPFLPVNCAAIPMELLESELFGHERGAFTGALYKKIGKLEQCNGGTIFLDEIGDMPLATQAKLLRVIQDQSFERVGGIERIRVDVRFLVATNKDLKEMISRGLFRVDLFDRLNVVRIHLPPLRERKEDIPLLVDYFLERYCMEMGRGVMGLSKEALGRMMTYNWPGNVRELENRIKRAVVLAKGDTITPSDLFPAEEGETPVLGDEEINERIREHIRSALRLLMNTACEGEMLSLLERESIVQALRLTGGNQTHAARLLGINRNTLRNKMRLYQIRGRDEPPLASLNDRRDSKNHSL